MNAGTASRGRGLAGAMAVVALLVGATAVPAADAETPRFSTEELRLKRQVEARFSIVPIREGVILVPRASRAGVQSIEVAKGGVGIDGHLVTGAELRGRLGTDADLVAALSYMDGTRLGLLFFPQTVTPAPTEAAPAVIAPTEAPPRATADEGRRYRRHTETRVAIGRSVRVAADERVRSAVVVVGGSAEVEGYVGDSVVVIGGSVRLGQEADVRGDVVVIGGTVDRQPGARVSGDVSVVGIGLPPFDLDRFSPRFHWPRFEAWRPSSTLSLFGTVTRFALFGLVAALFLLLAGRGIGRVERTVAHEPWKAGLIGLLAELIILPFFVLTIVILVVSIIGIPLLLLVPFAVLILVVGFVLGFTAVAARAGRVLTGRAGTGGAPTFGALLVGLAAVWGLTLVGRLVMLAGWPAWPIAALVLGVGFVVEYVAWTVGFGGVLLTRFGSRDRHPVARPPDPPAPTTEADLSLDGSGIA